MREREVARLEPAQVAQHLVLGVVAVEDRVGQERVLPRVGGGDRELDLVGQLLRGEGDRPAREGLEQGEELPGQGGLVEGDPDRAVLVRAQVDALLPGPLHDRPALLRRGPDAQRVEEGRRPRVEAEAAQAQLQDAREGVHASRDLPQAVRAVVDRVHRGHDGQQHLRGADVARRLVAADVLLAGLQRQPEGRPALGVLRDAHDPPRQVPLVLLLRGEEGGVRPAVAHRHAEALGRAERHVRAELARRAEEGEGEEVRRHHEKGPGRVGALGEAGEVAHDAVRGRVLHQHAEELLAREVDLLDRAHVDLDPEGLRLRAHDRDRLRVAVLRHEEAVLAGPGHRAAQRHRLAGGRGLVEERRVGEGQAGEVGHHRLVVEQRLETALRDLGLVGRVLGVPARVLQDVAQDDGRRVAVVVAHADEGAQHAVLRGLLPQLLERLLLAQRQRQGERAGEADPGRHRLAHEGVERRHSQRLQHPGDLGLARADVAAHEVGGGVSRARAPAGAVTEAESDTGLLGS